MVVADPLVDPMLPRGRVDVGTDRGPVGVRLEAVAEDAAIPGEMQMKPIGFDAARISRTIRSTSGRTRIARPSTAG